MNIKPTAFQSKTTPWRVFAPVGFRGSETRKPHYFATKSAANDFCKELNAWKDRQRHGADNILTFEESEKRWVAYLKQELPDLSVLPRLVEIYKRDAAITQITLPDAIETFIDHVETQEKPRPAYLADIVGKLNRFSAEFPGAKAHEFDRAEVKEYLSDWENPATRNQHLKRLSKFFDWSRKERFVAIDPTVDIDFAKVESVENILIYSVDEITRLVRMADTSYKAVAPWFILGAFGFMRSCEIERIEWPAFDFDRGAIVVSKSVSKTNRRRVIEINPTLRHWLEPYRKASGHVVDHLNGDLNKCFDTANIESKRNALRHSCVSYAVKGTDMTLAEVFLQAGHTPSVALKHYIEQMTRGEALPYWQIRRDH